MLPRRLPLAAGGDGLAMRAAMRQRRSWCVLAVAAEHFFGFGWIDLTEKVPCSRDSSAFSSSWRARLCTPRHVNVPLPIARLATILLLISFSADGAEPNNRLQGGWNHAFSFDENTLLPGFSFGAKVGPGLPFYETFRLGGFLNLPGFLSKA